MAGVAGSEPQDIAAPVQQAQAPQAVKMPSLSIPVGSQQTEGAPQAASSGDPDFDAVMSGKQQAKPSGDPDFDAVMASASPPEQSTTGKIVEGAGKALGYVGGLARTGIAAALQSGNMDRKSDTNIVSTDDIVNAFKGNAPTSDELLKRAGVGEGPGLDTPLGKITARNVGGFLADVGTDPLGDFAKMAKEAPYIKTLLNSPTALALDPTTAAGRLAKSVRQMLYDSAYSGVDAKLADKGKGALATALGDNAPAIASSGNVTSAVQKMLGTMNDTRQALYDKASELGATIDMGHPLERAESVITGLTGEQNASLRDSLTELLNKFKANGVSSIDDVSQWKTDLYNTIGAAMGKDNSMLPIAKRFKKALSLDLKDSIVEAGETAQKGLGQSIDSVNDKWGTLLEAAKLKDSGMQNPGLGKIGTAIDLILLGHGNLGTLAVKKAGELALSPAGKSAVGSALMKGAQSGVAAQLVRQGVVHASAPSPSQSGQQ